MFYANFKSVLAGKYVVSSVALYVRILFRIANCPLILGTIVMVDTERPGGHYDRDCNDDAGMTIPIHISCPSD